MSQPKRTFEERKQIVLDIINEREADKDLTVKKACANHGISIASYNLWKSYLKPRKGVQALLVPSEGLKVTPKDGKCVIVVSEITQLKNILHQLG